MFRDRIDAGDQLARRLMRFESKDVVVVGLPRGGVPVAYEVARSLGAPLDVILVRKLGVPRQPELAMGAIGENDVRVLNEEVVRRTCVSADELAHVEARERTELARRAHLYRAGRLRISLANRVVIVVDDGIATGATAKAACQIVNAEGAASVVLAVPVAPTDWTNRLAGSADEMISLKTPRHFGGVGQFYEHFGQTSDTEVITYLDKAAAGTGPEVDRFPRS